MPNFYSLWFDLTWNRTRATVLVAHALSTQLLIFAFVFPYDVIFFQVLKF